MKIGLSNMLCGLGLAVLAVALIHFKYLWQVEKVIALSEARGVQVSSITQSYAIKEQGPFGPGSDVFCIHGVRKGKPVTLWAQKLWDWEFVRETGPNSYVAEK
jgi:hypothetical protein